MGAWTSLQAALDLDAAQKSHLLWGTLARATAPAASGSALLLAFVVWAHPLAPGLLSADLPRTTRRAAAVALPGYLLSVGVSLLAGALLVSAVRGGAGHFTLPLRELAVGAGFAALDGALILALAWRFLPRLSRSRLSLPGTLSLVVAVTVPLRVTVALVAASVLSP
ncbi:MAG: hypothetical protein K0R38_1949 [Polyangiaceae bacterium]|jgi:hypothetical protein|nr:hypothetical protein [Polyangiaceae bacterium]